ncbi:MAG: hypothetical protein SFU57_10475 [Gemmatimonadales bacterium]|nr:hypothetical protein [Gemmatimonadales bacterium]
MRCPLNQRPFGRPDSRLPTPDSRLPTPGIRFEAPAMTALRLLRPGELQIVEVEPASLRNVPLDSILISCDGSKWLERFAFTLSMARRHPWLPLAIGLESTDAKRRPDDIRFEGVAFAIWEVSGQASRDALAVRTAVRSRSAPSTASFADFLADRFDHAARGPLAEMLESRPISRSTAAMMRRHGPFGPPRWRGLFHVVQLFADAGMSASSLEVLAGNRKLVPKTVWQWSCSLFGLDWRSLRDWQSWEALTELALRRAGYRCPMGD